MICKQQFLDRKYKSRWYCDNPELIENYDLAIADTEKTWLCHHRLEEFYTMSELISMGLYYKRPPEELIFVENDKEHRKLPHKGKGGQPGKQVLCVETGVVFPSTRVAEKQTGIYHGNISKCCKGKLKTTGGFHWAFAS